jgi:hypothetical protein
MSRKGERAELKACFGIKEKETGKRFDSSFFVFAKEEDERCVYGAGDER